jgi:hypothetical protein
LKELFGRRKDILGIGRPSRADEQDEVMRQFGQRLVFISRFGQAHWLRVDERRAGRDQSGDRVLRSHAGKHDSHRDSRRDGAYSEAHPLRTKKSFSALWPSAGQLLLLAPAVTDAASTVLRGLSATGVQCGIRRSGRPERERHALGNDALGVPRWSDGRLRAEGPGEPAFAVDRFLLLMLAGVLSIVPLCNVDVSPVPGEACPARFRFAIGADEVPIAFTWARIPRSQSPGLSFLGIRVVVEVVDLVRSQLALKTIRERSDNLGFPLDRKMAMLATSRHLLIWRASRHGLRAPKLLGAVARDHITSARLPFIGGGWRVVEVNLVDGSGVRFLADGRYAEQFAGVLRGHG